MNAPAWRGVAGLDVAATRTWLYRAAETMDAHAQCLERQQQGAMAEELRRDAREVRSVARACFLPGLSCGFTSPCSPHPELPCGLMAGHSGAHGYLEGRLDVRS